ERLGQVIYEALVKRLGHEFLREIDREALLEWFEVIEKRGRKTECEETPGAGDLLQNRADLDKTEGHLGLDARGLFLEVEDAVEELPVHIHVGLALAIPKRVFAMETATAED